MKTIKRFDEELTVWHNARQPQEDKFQTEKHYLANQETWLIEKMFLDDVKRFFHSYLEELAEEIIGKKENNANVSEYYSGVNARRQEIINIFKSRGIIK